MTSGEHTKGADLLALADRVEKLTGPDRDVDYDISRALGKLGRYASVNNATLIAAPCQLAPAYTASLDAAITLVPEGLAWTLGQNVHHGHWQASVNHLDDEGAPESVGCSNATISPSLALTAACLRARFREAQAGGGE